MLLIFLFLSFPMKLWDAILLHLKDTQLGRHKKIMVTEIIHTATDGRTPRTA